MNGSELDRDSSEKQMKFESAKTGPKDIAERERRQKIRQAAEENIRKQQESGTLSDEAKQLLDLWKREKSNGDNQDIQEQGSGLADDVKQLLNKWEKEKDNGNKESKGN